jgi:hypothetical protein
MGEMVIAAFRPKPGHEADLLALARDHVLRALPSRTRPFVRGLQLIPAQLDRLWRKQASA